MGAWHLATCEQSQASCLIQQLARIHLQWPSDLRGQPSRTVGTHSVGWVTLSMSQLISLPQHLSKDTRVQSRETGGGLWLCSAYCSLGVPHPALGTLMSKEPVACPRLGKGGFSMLVSCGKHLAGLLASGTKPLRDPISGTVVTRPGASVQAQVSGAQHGPVHAAL